MPRITPGAVKGTRDYLPRDLVLRNRVFAQLRETFERYGYEPLETPTIERTDVLEGKYGEEGEKLLFRILRRGRDLDEGVAKLVAATDRGTGAATRLLSDEALRYDLTVPFARVVALYQNELQMPFRRYQIQPVWRADRPQKGRFREFYQCDVDCVGSTSVSIEAEMLAMANQVLERLGFEEFTIRINHRALLGALMASEGVPAGLTSATLVAIDKLDKIGPAGVRADLATAGLEDVVAQRVMAAISITGKPAEVVARLRAETQLGSDLAGDAALRDLEAVFGYLAALGVPETRYSFDVSTVRGLSYYTGLIFETVAPGAPVGSLCSGGRYDRLIGQFTGRDLPCTGISFGIDRIFTAMEILGLGETDTTTATQALVSTLGAANVGASFAVAQALRAAGIRTEVYADETRALKGQLSFAAKKGIPLLAIVGDDERQAQRVTLRDLRTGQQETLSMDNAV
ncbi:MAG TPA: histidine--tRNA ligase, partial [Ktedonobacterales bacterium]